MPELRVPLLRVIALIAGLSTSALAGDAISTGDYTLVKVVSRDSAVHPELITVHPARVARVDGRLTVEISLFSTMQLKMKLFQGGGENAVFFLTPESAEQLRGSAVGEIYRGRFTGEDTIRGTFSDGGSESGAFVLTKTRTVESKEASRSKQ